MTFNYKNLKVGLYVCMSMISRGNLNDATGYYIGALDLVWIRNLSIKATSSELE